MAADNLIRATSRTKNAVTTLKKKLTDMRSSIEDLSNEIEKVESKIDNILVQSDIYKSKVDREMGREVRRLERELALMKKEGANSNQAKTTEGDLQIATTIGIFDALLRQMCVDADDFRLASEAFLFPAVYERVMEGSEEAYYLDVMPKSATIVLARGREYIEWVRTEYDTHITDPETWETAIGDITNWWRNDALPMIYGSRDEQWEIDIPMTLAEMLLWRESPGDRPLNFPRIFDAYEVYRTHKDEIFEGTGIREFELQHFSY